ncbi:AcrR family transcriptional regulator [Variovorax boronicumulans]|uniref:TetR/AcrR family transcriptional regulator n=1 Tax=Variovorax boronicumulans TaxID=436515 RepID=UPI0027863F9A|nr:TetR/AcrR family transcriptional regulator [Variovorax boronicumulans]MDP9919025.1 AcrR family transcriptional regulator [Variovorax boronicumulans]
MAAVRQQILAAARVVFERKGVADASMSDVSTQAGLSVGSIYVHFRSKEDVLLQLIEAAEVHAAPFEACSSAGELLGLVESSLKLQERPDATNQVARTALEIAAITRRNPDVQAVVSKNFKNLRRALLETVVRIGKEANHLEESDMLAVGESILSLLVSAQAQMLIGVPTNTDAKMKAARLLIRLLHGAPVRVKR